MYGLGLTMTLQMVGGLRVCRRPRLGHCCRRLTLQAAITACRPVPLTQLPYTGVVDQAAKGYMYAMALFFGGLVRGPSRRRRRQLAASTARCAAFSLGWALLALQLSSLVMLLLVPCCRASWCAGAWSTAGRTHSPASPGSASPPSKPSRLPAGAGLPAAGHMVAALHAMLISQCPWAAVAMCKTSHCICHNPSVAHTKPTPQLAGGWADRHPGDRWRL